MGGLYPVDGKMVEQERVTEGFCDFPWRLLTIHSDGSLGACCVDPERWHHIRFARRVAEQADQGTLGIQSEDSKASRGIP